MPWPTQEGSWSCKVEGCPEPGPFDKVQKLAAHVRIKHPKPPGTDSSDAPIDGGASRVTEPGELPGNTTRGGTPGGGEPGYEAPAVLKVRYGYGLSPWLNLVGMSVYARNNYDGLVIQKGIPPLIAALDEYAEENEVLYKFLKAIAMTDSPTAKLIVASLAIIVPILANHRPDSKMLENMTGGLRMMPGTDIPALPKVMAEPGGEQIESFVQAAKSSLENLSEEDQAKITEAMNGLPADLMAKMFASVPTHEGGMNHPEAGADDGQS